MPVYNTKPDHFVEALACVFGQDSGLTSLEKVIIIDDGSTNEDIKEILRTFSSFFTSFIQLIRIEHEGTSAALNAGHALVKTEYVALMGSDDVCDKSRFRLQMEYLKRHPETDVLGTNLFAFWDDDITRKPIFTTHGTEIATPMGGDKRWVVNHGTVIYRNSAVLGAGGYNLPGRAQDVELWSRMLAKGYVFRNITQVICGWRRYR